MHIARDADTDLITEKVSEAIEIEPGVPWTRVFWIAYPPHVLAYGHEEDRISRAWGRGNLRREALAQAKKHVEQGWVIS
jgi:hypothetical protein